MINRKLILPTESRIHGDVYVRFGGRYGKTYRRKATRRSIPSLLLLHCENEGYKIPRFCTFDCVQRMNKPSEKQAKGGVELPRVSVNKGEKSFPVMLTTPLPASTRRPRRRSSMTILRNSPMKRRRCTMYIRRCRSSGYSM